MSTALIILAAGKGTRMESDLPKVMHELGGAPLFTHCWTHGRALDPARTVIVAGHGAALVEAAAREVDPEVAVVVQAEQLGTAHAVAQARSVLEGFEGDAVVLYGDTPFTAPATLTRLVEARKNADVVVLGFDARDPGRYGRLVMEGDRLARIVEFKDATDEERAITLCNSGVICADAKTLFDLIDAVGNDNASGEYYLTDVVEVANARGLTATAVACDEAETMGINTRAELSEAEEIFQTNARRAAMETGARLHAPATVHFSADTVIGRDAIIEPYVVFAPGVTVESGARIRAFSHLEDCHVSRDAVVGPYARLRPGTELSNGAKIGNFVEIKNARIGEGAKVNHLSYVGDATVGEAANIGAGTVTCNYDGVMKHHTTIGAGAFIGSDTMLVAPVTVGDNAMTATGAVITQDVPAGAMAIARAKQVNKPGLAVKLFERLRAVKVKKGK